MFVMKGRAIVDSNLSNMHNWLIIIIILFHTDVYLSLEESERYVDEDQIFTRVCLILSNVTQPTQVEISATIRLQEITAMGRW